MSLSRCFNVKLDFLYVFLLVSALEFNHLGTGLEKDENPITWKRRRQRRS